MDSTDFGYDGKPVVATTTSNLLLTLDFDGSIKEQISKIRENRTNHNPGGLKDKISEIDSFIAKNHDITPFIKFTLDGDEESFELDTGSSNSFKHYAVSLENQKTGVGQGNKFTLRIAFNPDFSHYDNIDINTFEAVLAGYNKACLKREGYNANQLNHQCTLQYGYILPNEGGKRIESPKYKGLLLKYTVNANKQIVEYVLEGYTGVEATGDNLTVNWYPDVVKVEKDDKNRLVATLTTKNNNTKTTTSIDSQLADLYADGITWNPYIALHTFLTDYNNNLINTKSEATKYVLVDCTDGKRGELKNPETLTPVNMSICRGQTPLQYIEYCISLFKYEDDDYAVETSIEQDKTTDRFIYDLVIDPNPDKNIVYVCVDVISSNDVKVAYEFIGYRSQNSLLVSYDLNYDGTVALALSNLSNDNSEDSSNSVYYIDNKGQLKKKISVTRDMFTVGEVDDVLINKQNLWIDKISCANNCTMVTLGIPFEISTGTVFRCGMYIKDVLHHSSGNCFVTNVTDIIDSNNKFTSTFNMIRLPGADASFKS